MHAAVMVGGETPFIEPFEDLVLIASNVFQKPLRCWQRGSGDDLSTHTRHDAYATQFAQRPLFPR